MRRAGNWFALAWTLAVGTGLLVIPVYASSSSQIVITPGEAPVRSATTRGETLLDVAGRAGAVALLLPVVLTAVPLVGRSDRARRTLSGGAAILLGVFVVLGLMSVGMFYVPAVLGLGFAAARTGGAA